MHTTIRTSDEVTLGILALLADDMGKEARANLFCSTSSSWLFYFFTKYGPLQDQRTFSKFLGKNYNLTKKKKYVSLRLIKKKIIKKERKKIQFATFININQ